MTKLEKFFACVIVGLFFAAVVAGCNQTTPAPTPDGEPTTGTLPTSTPTETYF